MSPIPFLLVGISALPALIDPSSLVFTLFLPACVFTGLVALASDADDHWPWGGKETVGAFYILPLPFLAGWIAWLKEAETIPQWLGGNTVITIISFAFVAFWLLLFTRSAMSSEREIRRLKTEGRIERLRMEADEQTGRAP